VRPDPGGASDDRKLTGFGCFSPSDKASEWIADRLVEGPTGIGGMVGRLFCLGIVTALALCNHSLTLIYVDVSMLRHRVNKMR
jgi:hypothetical protein